MRKNLSQLKRQRQNVKRREINKSLRSTMRTSVRKARTAIEENPASDQTKVVVAEAARTIDKMVTKGLIHGKTGARYKSRMIRRANKGLFGPTGKAPSRPVPDAVKPEETPEA